MRWASAEDYETDTVNISEMYSGEAELEVAPEAMNLFFEKGSCRWRALFPEPVRADTRTTRTIPGSPDTAREGRLRTDYTASTESGGSPPGTRSRATRWTSSWTTTLRLVTLVGQAGTGKTLLALAAGLEKTVEERTFNRLVVSRPIFPLGRDLGFLPGDVEEKLRPWMQPIFDNLEFLMGPTEPAGARERRTTTASSTWG